MTFPDASAIETDDGAQLSVHVVGSEKATTALLVHGFSLDRTTWDDVRAGLVANNVRVVTTDLRGHGASTLGTVAPTIERLVADLATIIHELGLTQVHLVGHSLGAVIALAARTDPTVAPSLATVTSIAGTERSIQNPIMKLGATIFSSRAGIWALGRPRIGRLIIRSWFGPSPRPELLDETRLISAACARTTRDAITATTSDLDLRPSFSEPGPPTLLLCGEKDMATPAKVSKRIAEAIDGAEFIPIERAGHMVILEQPDEVVNRLTTWFAAP